MRWESLILDPIETVRLSPKPPVRRSELSFAAQIWERLDHINLTGHHQHDYRAGKGVVGDWRNWLTNQHMDILRRSGLEGVGLALGYEPFHPFAESTYTPFQTRSHRLIARDEIHQANVDDDLFRYAFNKWKLDASQFNFRRHG